MNDIAKNLNGSQGKKSRYRFEIKIITKLVLGKFFAFQEIVAAFDCDQKRAKAGGVDNKEQEKINEWNK